MSITDRDAMFRVVGRVTRWSMVGNLTDDITPEARAAWGDFVSGYEPALLKFANFLLTRMAGGLVHPQDAGDVVQSFLIESFEHGRLAKADPAKGRFRVWVRIQLRSFVYHWVAYHRRHKRAPAPGTLLGSDALESLAIPATPEADLAFDQCWAETIVQRALRRIGEGNAVQAEILRDLIRGHGEPSADIAERLGLSHRNYTDCRHRARMRLSTLLAEAIHDTVGDDQEAFGEFDYLLQWLP